MARIRVSAERTIPALVEAVYALLADYREGHPSILPPAFSDFAVLEGGEGSRNAHPLHVDPRRTHAGNRRHRRRARAGPRADRILSTRQLGDDLLRRSGGGRQPAAHRDGVGLETGDRGVHRAAARAAAAEAPLPGRARPDRGVGAPALRPGTVGKLGLALKRRAAIVSFRRGRNLGSTATAFRYRRDSSLRSA